MLKTTLAGDAETPLREDVNVVSDPDAVKRSMVDREIMEYVMHEVLEKDFKKARASLSVPREAWTGESLCGVNRLHREACTAPASGRLFVLQILRLEAKFWWSQTSPPSGRS